MKPKDEPKSEEKGKSGGGGGKAVTKKKKSVVKAINKFKKQTTTKFDFTRFFFQVRR